MKKYTPSTVVTAVFLAALTCIFLIAFGCVAAEQPVAVTAVIEQAKSGPFRAGEFNLELGGNAAIGNAQRNKDDVDYGVSLGGNYWFTRNFGGGLRVEGEDAHGLLVKAGVARLSVRAPLWEKVAPYGYVDGLFHLERDRWEAGAGGGLDFRFIEHLGLFVEAGLNVDTRGAGRMRGGAGVRFSF